MKILGVAVRFNKIMVCLPKPNRHHNCFKYASETLGLPRPLGCKAFDQGFYTDNGVFLNRTEAYNVAKIKNQIINPDENEGVLFSENLW